MNLVIAFALSISLHMAGLYLFLGSQQGGGNGGSKSKGQVADTKVKVNLVGNPKSNKDDIIQKNRSDQIKIVKEKKKKEKEDKKSKVIAKKKVPKPKKKKEIECKYYYEGIGVWAPRNQYGGCEIEKVFAGYPAEEMGLQVGDLVIEPPCDQIRGPEGTMLHMKIMRGSQVLNLSTKREKICEG